MNIGPAFIANSKSAELITLSMSSFHHPTVASQAVLRLDPSQRNVVLFHRKRYEVRAPLSRCSASTRAGEGERCDSADLFIEASALERQECCDG